VRNLCQRLAGADSAWLRGFRSARALFDPRERQEDQKWGGNRSWRGGRAQEVAMSVIRTARQQGVDPIELMAAARREPTPKAAAMLRIPARASPPGLQVG